MKVDASKAIQPEQLGEALADIVMNWADGEEEKFFHAIDEAADACDDAIRQDAPVDTGEYRSKFAIDRYKTERHKYSAEWYVREPEYRLTHLLEYGHVIKDGTKRIVGQSPAITHIKYGKKIAERMLQEKLDKLYGGG